MHQKQKQSNKPTKKKKKNRFSLLKKLYDKREGTGQRSPLVMTEILLLLKTRQLTDRIPRLLKGK